MLRIYITWYERQDNFEPDYGREHHGTIKGENANDVMMQFRQFKRNFDLAKYTIPRITDIYD